MNQKEHLHQVFLNAKESYKKNRGKWHLACGWGLGIFSIFCFTAATISDAQTANPQTGGQLQVALNRLDFGKDGTDYKFTNISDCKYDPDGWWTIHCSDGWVEVNDPRGKRVCQISHAYKENKSNLMGFSTVSNSCRWIDK